MKILKLYENWSEDKIKRHINAKKRIEAEKINLDIEQKEIMNLLHEFFVNNPEALSEDLKKFIEFSKEFEDEGDSNFYIEGFYLDKGRFIVDISCWNEIYQTQFTDKQYNDFLNFMNNPNLYKDAKKYNL